MRQFRYLVLQPKIEPFLTDGYNFENNYEKGMKIFDFAKNKYTVNGKYWKEITTDSL